MWGYKRADGMLLCLIHLSVWVGRNLEQTWRRSGQTFSRFKHLKWDNQISSLLVEPVGNGALASLGISVLNWTLAKAWQEWRKVFRDVFFALFSIRKLLILIWLQSLQHPRYGCHRLQPLPVSVKLNPDHNFNTFLLTGRWLILE